MNQTNMDSPEIQKKTGGEVDLPFPSDKEKLKAEPESKTKTQGKVEPKEEAEAVTPTRALTTSEKQTSLIANLLRSKEKALENFLGDNKKALRFMSAAMHLVQVNPKLLECTPMSLLGALMECAALEFYPSTHSGDCYIIPYKDNRSGITNAQFQMGYRGFKTLAFDAGIAKIEAEIVYENDTYKERLGTNPMIEHIPAKGKRGEPVKAYAWAEIRKGDVIFKSMTKEEIMKIATTSASFRTDKKYGTKKSLWNDSTNDPELWMWKKTVIKQLSKLLPTSHKIDRAVYLDNVSERGGYIEGEKAGHAEVIEVPFDNSDSNIEAGKERKEALRKQKTAIKK